MDIGNTNIEINKPKRAHKPLDMQALEIAIADRHDAQEIAELHNKFLDRSQPGFFLGEITKEDMEKAIEKGICILVKEKASEKASEKANENINGKIIGYAFIENINPLKEWPNHIQKNIQIPEKHWYIDQVASLKKGVGSLLYKKLFEMFPDYSFSAHLCESPYPNTLPAAFHKKNHFKRVETFEEKEFHEIKNYKSGLWLIDGDSIKKTTKENHPNENFLIPEVFKSIL